MTPLGKAIISAGILIFTVSTLLWIFTGDAKWFLGGLAIFVSSILSSAVVSVETKQTRATAAPMYNEPPQQLPQQKKGYQHDDDSPSSPKTL